MLCRSMINVNNVLGRLPDNILLFPPCKCGEIEKKSYFCPLFLQLFDRNRSENGKIIMKEILDSNKSHCLSEKIC